MSIELISLMATLLGAEPDAGRAAQVPLVRLPAKDYQYTMEHEAPWEGCETAVLEATDFENSTAPFSLMFRFRKGMKIPPHYNATDENAVVVSGTLSMGEGDRFDPAKLVKLNAGSFFLARAKQPHFGIAETDVVLYVSGQGPFKTILVNEQDPANKVETPAWYKTLMAKQKKAEKPAPAPAK